MSPWTQKMVWLLANIMSALIDWEGQSPNSKVAKQVADLRNELETSRDPLSKAEEVAGK